MLLTRFVRNQLIIFTIASIVGVAVMVFTYMQLPALLGRALGSDDGHAVLVALAQPGNAHVEIALLLARE